MVFSFLLHCNELLVKNAHRLYELFREITNNVSELNETMNL